MSPALCNPFKKNKIVPCSSPIKNKKIPNNLSPYDSYDSTEDYHTPLRSKSSFEPNIKSGNYDNNTIEKIYVQLLDNEKRIKRLNFYIDRLDKATKNKMDILYEIEEKIDLYDLKLNKILHIR
jgi:hypothetical protein